MSHFSFLLLNRRYGYAKRLSSFLVTEVPEFSVSRGDESQKCWLGGNDGGLWFDLLLGAVTSPTPIKVRHGFGHVSKMFSASLVTHPGPTPAASQGRGAHPQPPKEQFVASASYFICHNQEELGPVVSVTALGEVAGCYHLPSNLSWDFWSQLPLLVCQGSGKPRSYMHYFLVTWTMW